MFFSQRVQAFPPFGIRRFSDIAATMTNVISLGIGKPDFITPALIRQAGIASIESGEIKYISNAGISEDITCAILALPDPGDEVIIPETCFVSYKPSVKLAGDQPVVAATHLEDSFQVTGRETERAVTPDQSDLSRLSEQSRRCGDDAGALAAGGVHGRGKPAVGLLG